MVILTPSAEAYARMIKALLPPGVLFRRDPDVLSRIIRACGDELERVSHRAKDLVEEADPRTTTELLDEFERVLGITGQGEGATEERRAFVVALLTTVRRFRPADFQQILAPLLALDPGDVTVIERDRAFAIAVNDDRAIYEFFIYRDPTLAGTPDIDAAQELVDDIAPSHTNGHVIETINFQCDDPHSLSDRDLLGM